MTDARPQLDGATIAAEDDGIRLDRWFKRHREGTPHALLARWARSGQLTLDGKKADVSDRIATGQQLVMPTPPVETAARPARKGRPLTDADVELATGMMIHRDASAIVLNKLPGLATQGGTKTEQHVDGLLDALKFDGPTRPKLVHRLDKDTSGALLIARTPRAAAYFAKSFSNRSARKTYWALIVGVPDIQQGEIDLPLAKQPGSGGEKMHVHDDGLPSKTRYRVIERAGNSAAWVELQPLTGRTHQLRVHMAAIGHPIVGDGKYGGKGAFLTGTISRKMHLHSRRLRIDHPDGGAIDVHAEVPEHFAASLDALGFDLLLGEVGTDDVDKGPPPKAAAKAAAKAHSKQIRKARRGERRGRTAEGKPTDFVGKPKPKPKSTKPVGKKPSAKKHSARPPKAS